MGSGWVWLGSARVVAGFQFFDTSHSFQQFRATLPGNSLFPNSNAVEVGDGAEEGEIEAMLMAGGEFMVDACEAGIGLNRYRGMFFGYGPEVGRRFPFTSPVADLTPMRGSNATNNEMFQGVNGLDVLA